MLLVVDVLFTGLRSLDLWLSPHSAAHRLENSSCVCGQTGGYEAPIRYFTPTTDDNIDIGPSPLVLLLVVDASEHKLL